MSEVRTFSDIEKYWPTRAEFARAIDVNQEVVRKWQLRGKVPSCYWVRVVKACQAIDKSLTFKQLSEMADIDRDKKNPRHVAA